MSRGDALWTGSVAGAMRIVGLTLSLACLVAFGCNATQRQARLDAAGRWNLARAQVKARLAADQLAAGHVDDAANELSAALKLDPANASLLILQARVCLARGDQRAAKHVLETVEAEGPQRAEVEYLLGTIEQQRLHWDQAFNRFVRAANDDPHEVAYVVAIVQNMLQLGEADKALTFLRSYEDEFGWTSAYQTALAECQEQRDDWQAAAQAWQRVADAGDATYVCERLALALVRCERWSQAVPPLRKALANADVKTSTPLRLALAQCLLETGQPTAAQTHLSHVLQGDAQSVPALQLMARACAQQGDFPRARRIAEQALRLQPEDSRTLELAAALAFRAGDRARACQLARQITRSSPDFDSPIARQILGRVGTPSGATSIQPSGRHQ